MVMQLVDEGEMFGALVALAEHRDAFTEDHAQLFTLLAEPFKVAMVNAIQHRDMIRLKDRLADDNLFFHRELQKVSGDEIVGADFGLKPVMHMVGQVEVAPTESPILLTGETGVGKDVIANTLHLISPRREGPFIPVNCGAIPATLLDEIGDMPLDAQVRLLRVLQQKEIERVGGTDRIQVDIRIIAATNKDLAKMVKEGRFREDLWFRLNVFPIVVPSLRDRTSDIPALVQHFIFRKAKELKIGTTPQLADGAMDVLMA